MKNFLIVLLLVRFSFLNAQSTLVESGYLNGENYIQYVDPMIGTAKFGHTFPGASMPLGMVQVSPDTDVEGWDYCSGYKHEDNAIKGFSHTHLSGTGERDLVDVLIAATTGKIEWESGTKSKPETGYYSTFDHKDEIASPGYYSCFLKDYNIKAELTATTRAAIHRYTYLKNDTANFIIDLTHIIKKNNAKVEWASINILNDSTLVGFRITTGWSRSRFVYFAIKFSKPFLSAKVLSNGKERSLDGYSENIKACVRYLVEKNNQIVFKVGISAVSIDGALKNMDKEIPHYDFDKTKRDAEITWNDLLKKISIKTTDLRIKKNFYTAIYHTYLTPNTFIDVDGKYAGVGQNIFETKEFVNYSTFSLWDTYRAVHPLFTILSPECVDDMVRSMIEFYNQNPYKRLPIWSFWTNETYAMSGVHSLPVIAEAYLKGIHTKYDPQSALIAMINSTKRWAGEIEKYGYSPLKAKGQPHAASSTLEQAYDDYSVAQMAKQLNDTLVYTKFTNRSKAYQHLFDTTLYVIRPKDETGKWLEKFNPAMNVGYSEGNANQYTWLIPHDIEGLTKLMNGKQNMEKQLDKLFETPLDSAFLKIYHDFKDGNIGNYVHANEPCHHIPYMYNFTNSPWKTHKYVNQIMTQFYDTIPSGITGNDDCGQMSAWYIFGALGFYPVDPVSCSYQLGTPLIDHAFINLPNGKTFEIVANNLTSKNIYVRSVSLNGNLLKSTNITHKDIAMGGKLVFEMSDKPNKNYMKSK